MRLEASRAINSAQACIIGSILKIERGAAVSDRLISPEQCRMARAGLGLTAGLLAKRAQVSTVTLSDFEKGKRSPHWRTIAAIRSALETVGVEFIDDNCGAGVRLKKKTTDATISLEELNAENDY
jgi:transcriptional regulator with XRE-family HTH domain